MLRRNPSNFSCRGQVGGQPCGELRGRAAHELVQPGILTAQGGPGLPSPPEGPAADGERRSAGGLPPPNSSGKWTQRALNCPEKSVANARPRSRMGPVASLNARRVSWYSFCQQVVRSTFGAHLVRRTGKNFRWILRIGALGMEGLLDRIIQGMEGRGHLPHFTGNCLPAALQVRSPPCPRGGWKGLFLLRADGQHQEDNGPPPPPPWAGPHGVPLSQLHSTATKQVST